MLEFQGGELLCYEMFNVVPDSVFQSLDRHKFGHDFCLIGFYSTAFSCEVEFLKKTCGPFPPGVCAIPYE